MFERVDQNAGWNGNLAAGDHLLWDQDVGPDITIVFGSPVRGAGAQIQANNFGTFVARITLSDGDTFIENGTSTSNGDGSAIFLGALDSVADIASLSFTLDSAVAAANDFAIDTLFLNTVPGTTHVPEPSTLAFLGGGLAVLVVMRPRRKRAKTLTGSKSLNQQA